VEAAADVPAGRPAAARCGDNADAAAAAELLPAF